MLILIGDAFTLQLFTIGTGRRYDKKLFFRHVHHLLYIDRRIFQFPSYILAYINLLVSCLLAT